MIDILSSIMSFSPIKIIGLMTGTGINDIVLVIVVWECTYKLCCIGGLDIKDDIFRSYDFGVNEEDIMI